MSNTVDRTSQPETSLPTRLLRGPEEASYLLTLRAAISAARLNNQYPDPRAVVSHLEVLDPALHRGLYPGLQLDLRSGLPSYKEWTRAQTDVLIAADQIGKIGPRERLASKAQQNPNSIHAKQLTKLDYYQQIRNKRLVPLGDMQVALKSISAAQKQASFHVVLDKLDVSGTFVRYSIDLGQTSETWNDKILIGESETARHTEQFQSLIYSLTSWDAEFTFVKLATMGGLKVERVVKGTIGPLYSDWVRPPEPWRPLVEDGSFLATFGLDVAAVDVSNDRDNDPFDQILLDKLSADAKVSYRKARQKLGYKVFKDRKFVISKAFLPLLRETCSQLGTQNIIYPLPYSAGHRNSQQRR